MKSNIKLREFFKSCIVLIFVIIFVSASFGSIPASDAVLEQLEKQNNQGDGQLKTEMSQSIYGSENGLDGLFGAKNNDSFIGDNEQVNQEVQIGITYQNPYITDNTETLYIHYEQNIEMLEDGRADTDLKINIPPSVYAEQYKEMLGVTAEDMKGGNPFDFIISEESIEQENGVVSAGRDEYYYSIESEQWFLLGVNSEVTSSEVRLNDETVGEVAANIHANTYPTLIQGKSGDDEYNQVLFGPQATDSMDNVTEYISTLVGYSKLMLNYFPGDLAFQRTWDTKISFPEDSLLINQRDLQDRQWSLYFGGGTYFISNLTQIDDTTLLLREKFFVTNYENIEPVPIGNYKSFDVQYIILGEKNDSPPLNRPDDSPFGSGIRWNKKIIDFDYSDFYVYTALGGDVEVNFSYWMNADVYVILTTSKASVKIVANAGVDINASLLIDHEINYNLTLWELKPPKIFNIQVGPIPVIITCNVKVEFKFTLGIDIRATFDTGYRVHAEIEAGVKYSFWDGFKTIWTKTFTTEFIEPKWNFEMRIRIHPRVEVPISALVYHVIGPVITPGIHLEGKLWTAINSDTGEWTEPLWYIEAYINVLLGVKIGIPYLYENQWDWEIARWVFWSNGTVDPSNTDSVSPTSQIYAMSPPYVYLGGDINDDQNWIHGKINYIWLYAEDEAQEGSIPEGLESIYVIFTDANGDSEPADYTYPEIWNITVTNPDPIYGYYDVTYWSEDNAGNKEDNNYKRFWVETYPPESWIVDQENLPEQLRAYATPVNLRASDSHAGIPNTGSQIFYQIWYEGTWSSWKSVDLNSDANVFFYNEGEHQLRWYAIDEVWNKESNNTETFDVLAPQAGGHYTFSNVYSSDCTEIDDGTVDITFEMPESKICHRLLGLYNVTHDNKSIPQEAQIQVYVDPDNLWGTLESINLDPGDSTTKATDNSIPLDQISKFRLHVSDDAISSNFTSGFIYYVDDGDVFIDPHSGYTCSEMINSCEGVPKTTFATGETFYAVFKLTSHGETHNFLGNHIKLRAWFKGSMYDSTEFFIDQSGYSVCLPWTILVNMEGSGYVELMWKIDPSDAYQTLGKTDTFHITEQGYSSELIVGIPQYPPDTGPFVKTTTSFDFPQTESERYRYTIKSPFGGYVEETWQDYTGTFYLPKECSNLIEYTKDGYDFVVTNETSGEGVWVFNSTRSTDYSDTFYADDTAPTSSIAIGNPYYTDYNTKWIMPDTPITLTAIDGPCCEQGCFPVGVKEIRYDYGEGWKTASGDTFTFKYNPNLMDHYWGDQTIKWYAVDYLGNDESETIIHEEHVKVVIPLSMDSNEWFLDGAHQDNSNYGFGQGSNTDGLTSENLNWELTVDKDDPYSGLAVPNAFVDFFYDNQGMDWSQVESIDMIVKPDSSYNGEAQLTMRIDNLKNKWIHDLSTTSTKTGEYTATINRKSWNTYTWNLGTFPRNDLKSFRLQMTQNNGYANDGEDLSFFIKDIMVAGPIGLDQGQKNHSLKDITANTHDFTVTTTEGDWCFEHYTSNPVNIQHAVNWAKEGLTITVNDGTYYENVYMFRDDVVLQKGSNPIIDGQSLGPAISMMAHHLTVDGFEIKNGLTGIYAPGTSNHIIKNCIIHHNTNDGIYMSNSNNHQINNCDIYQNDNDGIHTDTVSILNMQTLIVNNNGKDGMYLSSSSNIDVDNSNIYQNTDDGVDAPGTSDTDFDTCLVHNNGDDGVYLDNSNTHIFSNTDLYLNGHDGLHGEQASTTTMTDCDIYENTNDGVYLFNSNNHDFTNVHIYQNGDDGLDAQTASTTTLTNCEINNHPDNGIFLSNSISHTIQQTTIHNNQHDGLHGETINDVTIQQSNIHDNTVDGAFFSDSSNIAFINVNISLNQDEGVHLDTCNDLTMESCTVNDQSDNGIYAFDSQTLDILNSDIYQNYNHGIYVEQTDELTVDTCNIYDNAMNGVYIQVSSDNVFQNSLFYNNGANGLKGEQVTSTIGSICEFYLNLLNGIHFVDSDTINFDLMQIYENGEYGCKLETTNMFTLSNSNIYQNAFAGGYLSSCSDCSFINDNIYVNENDGLFGETLTRIFVDDCEIYDNDGNGVFFYDSIDSNIKASRIFGNKINMFEENDFLSIDTIPLNDNISLFDLGGIGIMIRSLNLESSGNVIDDNDIQSNERQGIFIGGTLASIPYHNIISNNNIFSNGLDEFSHGIFFSRTDNNTIENNLIYHHTDPDYNGTGIYLFESSLNNILSNRIYGNDEQIRFADAGNREPKKNDVHYNFFAETNNFVYGIPSEETAIVNYYQGMIVDATYNWWSMPDGPSGYDYYGTYDPLTFRPAHGDGMKAIGKVHFDPWAGIESLPYPDTLSEIYSRPIHFSSSKCFAYYIDGTSHDFNVLWDFGDGTTSTEKEVDHIYDTVGRYNVKLSVDSEDPMFSPSYMYDKSEIDVTICPITLPLNGSFNTNNDEAYVNQTVIFTASAEGGQPPYEFFWDFGDGSPVADGMVVYHSFIQPGEYMINLTMFDDLGARLHYIALIPVYPPPTLEVDAGGPYPAGLGIPLRFEPTASNGISPYLFWWDFEGEVIDPVFGKHPHMVFEQDGTYTLQVTARDVLMTTAQDSVIITPGSFTQMMEDQDVFTRGFPIRYANDGSWTGAQSFYGNLNMISRAEIYLRRFGTPEFDLTVELRSDSIDGPLLDTITLPSSEIAPSWNWVSIDFNDAPMNPETEYFIICPPAPSGVTSSFGYEWGYAFGNQYDDGAFWFTRDGGVLWRALPTMYEFTFRTYGYN